MSDSLQLSVRLTFAGILGVSILAGGNFPSQTHGDRAFAQSEPSPETATIQVESQVGNLQRRALPAGDPLADWEQGESETAEVGVEADDVSEDPTTASADPLFELDLGIQQEGSGGGRSAGEGNGLGSNGQEGTGESLGTQTGNGSNGGAGSGVGTGSSTGDGAGDGGGGTGQLRRQVEYIPEVTGLIVDARELDFIPSMSMRLFDPDGNQVYTTPTANRNLNASFVSSEGTALFVTSEDLARSLHNRIGERPLEISAKGTRGYDLVISNSDAWQLRQKNIRDRFLDNFAVVVIWSPN
ncbi:hypothetical protein [Synechococcus sp. PCC 7336]|uniref:hypothetical protein n=1 Tax=Synechococcus sp. PCC 7336 TaxID=195250 RepID=UPI00034DB178|nr:hypothetical protein [Synechococcus sp. PCC 7336]